MTTGAVVLDGTGGQRRLAPASSAQRFRRRALSVTAAVLAVGMTGLTVVLALFVPMATTLDLVLLGGSAMVHGVVAVTVGRTWDPGGAVNIVYVLANVVLIAIGVFVSVSPATDVAWFLLAPVALAAITLSTGWQVATAGLGIAGYLGASALGPGIAVGYASQRSTAIVIFAVVMWFLTARLYEALDTADAARAALVADVAEAVTANEELQRLDVARDDYVSSVSHELRTPLTVILGLTQTLHDRWDDLDDDQRRHMTHRVGASARALEGIVSALLDLTRIERGGVHPVLAPVELAAAVTASVQRLATVLRDHDVRTQVADDVVVRTDERLLERVLDNLLVNAARHTPAGTSVTLEAEVADDRVRVAVRDDGPGIPAADVERLGQQFFRAGGDPHVEGLGLGLALVVEVLGALDEELEVASELGRGTVFSFSLPLVGAGAAPVRADRQGSRGRSSP